MSDKKIEGLCLKIKSVGKIECQDNEIWIPVTAETSERFYLFFERSGWERLKTYVDVSLSSLL